MTTTVRLDVSQEDILLLMDCLIHATDHALPNRRFPSEAAKGHIGDLYQAIGQASGEQGIVLEFQTDDENP